MTHSTFDNSGAKALAAPCAGSPKRPRIAVTLEQLRIFVAVAEREHVTRAAETLDMAQSAVSNAMIALETGLGVKLFERVGRNIRLSTAGAGLYVHAQDLLACAERLWASYPGARPPD